ncbi:MAG: DUF2155 domain-containing protein [Rubricella sp.]
MKPILTLLAILAALPAFSQVSEEPLPPRPEFRVIERQNERPAERPEVTTVEMDTAILRGLDKMTNRVEDIRVPVGGSVQWERLEIRLEACRAAAPDAPPDAYAWLSIRDTRWDEPDFTGWMIASSPALFAMDHPRYDIWVTNCVISDAGAEDGSAPQSE